MAARPIRNFLQLLGLIERGRFEEACNEALEKTIDTLQNLPKGEGKATITVQIEVATKKEMLYVTPKIVCKLPDDKAFAGTPFWAFEGGLSTQHPNQMDMLEPREVRQAPPRAEPAADRA